MAAVERAFVFDALCVAFDEIVPRLQGGWSRRGDGWCLRVCPSVPFDLFCGLWLTDPSRDTTIAAELPTLIAELDAAGVPASVFLPARGYERTREAASEEGLSQQEVQMAMTLMEEDIRPEPAADPEFSVEPARDGASLTLACRVCAAGFEAPEALFAPLYEPAFASHSGITVYVGRLGETGVSTGVGFLAGRAIGVYSVATPPDRRRRGYAERVVRRIVRDGFAAGAARAYLLATPEGVGPYRRAGFRSVGRYHTLGRSAEERRPG